MSSESVNQRSKSPCPQCSGTGRDERGRNCPMCGGHAFALVSYELVYRYNKRPFKHPRDAEPEERNRCGGVALYCPLPWRYWER